MRGMTANQLEILQHVGAGGPDGPLDFDQLLERLTWKPSKESAQFPIRALVKRGLLLKGELEYRRGRRRVMYHLTEEGRLTLDPRSGPAPKAVVSSKPAPSEKVDDTILPGLSAGLLEDLPEVDEVSDFDPGVVEILEG